LKECGDFLWGVLERAHGRARRYLRVHGAIFFRDHIRDKDKDPSLSATQARAEGVWAL